MKVNDIYTDTEFEDLLSLAERAASRGWDMQFVSDMREKFDEYGGTMFLSEKQDEHLHRIAGDY